MQMILIFFSFDIVHSVTRDSTKFQGMLNIPAEVVLRLEMVK